MPNIICSICTEAFNNSDDIYSTSCGHIFHYSCLNQWRTRGTSCPECRSYNPKHQKIYLNFDEQINRNQAKEKISKLENDFMQLQAQYTELTNFNKCKTQELRMKSSEIKSLHDTIKLVEVKNGNKLVEMEMNLKSSNEKNSQLLQQISEAALNIQDLEEKNSQMSSSYLQLQKQFTICKRIKRDLEQKNSQMNNNYLQLQEQYTICEQTNRALEERNSQIDRNYVQLQEQFAICEQTKLNLEERNRQMDDNVFQLQEKLNICEKTKRDLEEKIKKIENKFTQLHAEYKESNELLNPLKDKILEMTILNKYQFQELRKKCLQIESLREKLQLVELKTSASILLSLSKVMTGQRDFNRL